MVTLDAKRGYGARRDYGAPVGRRVYVGQLVGLREIAECLGLPRVQSMQTLRRRDPSFPTPVWSKPVKGGVGVWYWPDVSSWARAARCDLRPRAKAPVGGRRVDVDHLVGASDIAAYLGMRGFRWIFEVRQVDQRFPEAVFVSLDGPYARRLWSWPDVWRWAKARERPFPADLGRSPSSVLRRQLIE